MTTATNFGLPLSVPEPARSLIEEGLARRDGVVLRRLWEGDGSVVPGDALVELSRRLAACVGPDEGLVDEIVRQSPAFPDDWDRPGPGGQTQRKRVLAAALNLVDVLGTRLLSEYRFAKTATDGLCVYDGTCYRVTGDEIVVLRVRELLSQWRLPGKRYLGREVIEYVLVTAPELWDQPPEDEIHVRNGILNVLTRTLRPHDPDFLSTIQLPIEFDPSAQCPAWECQVRETFPEGAERVAWELLAWAMAPWDGIQKAALFVGSGANGKSIFLNGMTAFLGHENVSHIPLQKLASNQFAGSDLIGKLANIVPDLPRTRLPDASLFKSLTARDEISVEPKYRAHVSVKPTSVLIFAANEIPESNDDSAAYLRRWLVVPFERTFTSDEVKPAGSILAALTTDRELSGLLNRALEVLPELRARMDFSTTDVIKSATDSVGDQAEPGVRWLRRRVERASGDHVSKAELHKVHKAEMNESGEVPLSKKALGRALRRLYPTARSGRIQVDGDRQYVWEGVRLGDPEEVSPESISD